jgi:hypothetical protein
MGAPYKRFAVFRCQSLLKFVAMVTVTYLGHDFYLKRKDMAMDETCFPKVDKPGNIVS